MKRSWSALAPCPIAKELIPVHPRKVYYYLTTMQRQPLPENSDDIMIPSGMVGKQMTPSVTSVDQDDEDIFAHQRSPSPEVDLSSPTSMMNTSICTVVPMVPPDPAPTSTPICV